MSDSRQKSTGTSYISSLAFLALAFIISSAILVVSRPLAHISVLLATASSAVCVVLAWGKWDRTSQLIPSLAIQGATAK